MRKFSGESKSVANNLLGTILSLGVGRLKSRQRMAKSAYAD
jgi:hypothetical protein